MTTKTTAWIRVQKPLRSYRISTAITKAAGEKLERIAKKNYLTKSSLVAKILDEYLARLDDA
jgi:uncharacterized protein YkwD